MNIYQSISHSIGNIGFQYGNDIRRMWLTCKSIKINIITKDIAKAQIIKKLMNFISILIYQYYSVLDNCVSNSISVILVLVMAHKYCEQNGTWFRHPESNQIWSNYTTCVNLQDLSVSNFRNDLTT